jgi:glutathione S-transferase
MARLMLERKGVDYKLVQLPLVVCRPLLRAMGFPGPTVPALKLDGRKVQTTGQIARALDELRPDPPLLPADAEERSRIEEAERWGDEVLQDIPRRLVYATPIRKHARADLASFFEGPLLGMPPKAAVATAAPLLAAGARVNSASDEVIKKDLRDLPATLDHVDQLIADGVIGGEEPSVADYQVGVSVRLLMCFEDVRPLVEGRPAADLAMRIDPDYPGHVRAVLPREWLPA